MSLVAGGLGVAWSGTYGSDTYGSDCYGGVEIAAPVVVTGGLGLGPRRRPRPVVAHRPHYKPKRKVQHRITVDAGEVVVSITAHDRVLHEVALVAEMTVSDLLLEQNNAAILLALANEVGDPALMAALLATHAHKIGARTHV